MKILPALVVVMLIASCANAQINAKTSDGKDVILDSNGTWHYAQRPLQSPPATLQTVSKDCDKFSIGDLRVINLSENATIGRICFRSVDTHSGEINSLFCDDFTIGPGDTTYYSDVLAGAVQLKYGFNIPDPDKPKSYTYSNVRNEVDSAVTCKVREIILNNTDNH